MIFKNDKVRILYILLIFTIFFSAGAWAKGNNPLYLESSNPSQDEKNISTNLEEIKLVFSKNVVNMKVKDNNLKCFKLYDKDGNEIPIEVVMADDQIEREKRHDIILKIKKELEEGMTYTIEVSQNLQAKNGKTLDEPLEMQFRTEGGKNGNNKYLLIAGLILIGISVGIYIKNKKRK